jgi:hypothetical protein
VTTPEDAPPGTIAVGTPLGRAYQIHDGDAFIDALRPAIMANLEKQRDGESYRTGDGWEGEIGGACPVQGYGVVDGYPWYFRARGSCWSLDVAVDPLADPVGVGWDVYGFSTGGEADEGEMFSASWMSFSEAWRHIEQGLLEFQGWNAMRQEQQ